MLTLCRPAHLVHAAPGIVCCHAVCREDDESQLSVLTAFSTLALQAIGDRHNLPGWQRPPGGSHDDYIWSDRQCYQGALVNQTVSWCWMLQCSARSSPPVLLVHCSDCARSRVSEPVHSDSCV